MAVSTYREIYKRQSEGDGYWRKYGHSNHGAGLFKVLVGMGARGELGSVLDVGCGHNRFAKDLRAVGITALGVDCACPGADVVAPLLGLHERLDAIPFDLVTAFDVLEHLHPHEIEASMRELSRLAYGFAFSIAYRPSTFTLDGENLHPTCQPREWWVEQIEGAGGTIVQADRYIIGNWGAHTLWGET